jgi:hypothetical protein
LSMLIAFFAILSQHFNYRRVACDRFPDERAGFMEVLINCPAHFK